MKFCYIDESGYGNEPIFVITGVITDSSRMHLIKAIWVEILGILREATGRDFREFHSRNFYRGNSPYRNIDGDIRADIITQFLELIKDRRHTLAYSAIDKDRYNQQLQNDSRLRDIGSLWRTGAFHLALSLQRYHQNQKKNKGHTVLIFDREDQEEDRFINLIQNPPDWSDEYYSRRASQNKMDQIIDVPYFADSIHVILIQIADLIAYVLRRYAELEGGYARPRYRGEAARFQNWAQLIAGTAAPVACMYPQRGRGEVAQMFWDIAPNAIRTLR